MDTTYSKHPRVRSGENDRIAQEYDREDGKSKSSKEIGKETKWSDRSPTARNDGGNEFTKQRQDTGEIKQRKVESKKKIQTFLLKVINFAGSEAEFKTMLKKVSRHTFVIKDYKLDGHDTFFNIVLNSASDPTKFITFKGNFVFDGETLKPCR